MTSLPQETFDWFIVLLHLHHLVYGDEKKYFGLYTVGGIVLDISTRKHPECIPFEEFAENTAEAISKHSGAGMIFNGAVELIPKAAGLQPPPIEFDFEKLPSHIGMLNSLQIIRCRLTSRGRERAEHVATQFSDSCLNSIKDRIRLASFQT